MFENLTDPVGYLALLVIALLILKICSSIVSAGANKAGNRLYNKFDDHYSQPTLIMILAIIAIVLMLFGHNIANLLSLELWLIYFFAVIIIAVIFMLKM